MDGASFEFVFFGLAASLISNFSRSCVWRSTVLFGANVVFILLLAGNPITLLPLIGFLLLGYLCLVFLEHGWSKSLIWSIIAVIFAYIWLKKYTFLPEASFLDYPYFTLGLSYIFFREVQVLVEAGDGDEKRHIGFGAYLLYTLNFTTLISGPIQRYDDFAHDQFASEPIPLGPSVVGLQLERIVRGFFKVNVLSVLFYAVQEDALAQLQQSFPPSVRLFAAFQLAVVYPFYLYSNFSGYIDIVIALARLMRVRLPENFDRPFSACSFIEFWSRWHITLSFWLKTFVYNPLLLALMRRISSLKMQPYLGVFCFFVTFFLVGIWHGRTSEFVVFGVLQGGGVAINKLWQLLMSGTIGSRGYRTLAKSPIYMFFARGLTFSWFACTLFWFWASWKQIDVIFTALSAAQWLGVWIAIWFSTSAVLGLWEQLRASLLSIKISEVPLLTSRYARVMFAPALGLFAIVMTIVLNQPAPSIVYKTF